MSDGVDIRSGGAIAVDTDTLRGVADGYAGVAARLDELLVSLDTERARLLGVDLAADAQWRLDFAVRTAGFVIDAASRLAERLRSAATVYEIVELHARRSSASAAGDADEVAAVDARVGAILAEHPFLFVKAYAAETAWRMSAFAELARQAGASPLGAFGASAASAFGALVAANGRGRVPRDSVLRGPPVPITLSVGAPAPAKAPASLSAVVERIPRGPAQVRVERYAMADGSRRFAVYVAGTRSLAGVTEPWNMQSNQKLYAGERSASYEATAQALHDAGARPGDAIYAFGHSQGGMIAGHLAVQEGYEAQALVTFGSPTSADVGPDTLSVQLRHTDDPVVALSDGGHPASAGSADSFVVERLADPMVGVQDVGLVAHGLDEYRETAAMLDASSDPRAAALDDLFTELRAAESVDVLEFEADQPGPAATPVYPESRRTTPGGVVSPGPASGAG